MWMVHAPAICQPPVVTRSWARPHTFCVGPVGIQVGQRSLVTNLLEGLRGLVVDLEDAARSPPAATSTPVRHVEIGASTARRFRARVVGDGTREEDWRRQLGGIDGVRLGRVSERDER